MAKFEITGVKELNIKLSRFNNFLGKEYNKTIIKIAKWIVNKFRYHIDQHRTERGQKYGLFPDLEDDYKDIKKKRHGKVYPILRASDKMYNDIKYFINTSWKQFKTNNKIKLSFGFKTKRSEKIAGYHHRGIDTKRGKKIRDPFFLSKGEVSWVIRQMNEATKKALRKARLKRSL